MRPIRAVFLDAGNTLFTERTSRAAIYADVLRRRGFAIDDAAMRRHLNAVHAELPREIEGSFRYAEAWFRVFIDGVLARAGFGGDFDAVAGDLFDAFKRADSFRVFPEVRPVVKRLKGAGVRLGVISNWSPTLPALLSRLGFDGDFEVVVASGLVRSEKPEAAIFRRGLEALRVSPQESLHAGDHPDKDVGGAQAVGMTALLVDREDRHRDHPARVASLRGVLEAVGLPVD